MDLKFETEAPFLSDSQAWLASRAGVGECRPVTLNLALFVKATHFPNGFIPSGIVVGKVTATGLYGPYIPGDATGLQAARGLILSAVEVKSTNEAGKAAAALFFRGVIKEARLPANHGLDAAAKVDFSQQVDALFADAQAPYIRVE